VSVVADALFADCTPTKQIVHGPHNLRVVERYQAIRVESGSSDRKTFTAKYWLFGAMLRRAVGFTAMTDTIACSTASVMLTTAATPTVGDVTAGCDPATISNAPRCQRTISSEPFGP
jgi:hypothetical protein